LRFGERQTNDGTHFTAEGLSKSFAAPDRRLGSMICSKTVEANLLAVLGLAFLILVVMPFLIYVSVALVMRAARLSRAARMVNFDAPADAPGNVADRGIET
jgi:hypothetical protein